MSAQLDLFPAPQERRPVRTDGQCDGCGHHRGEHMGEGVSSEPDTTHGCCHVDCECDGFRRASRVTEVA